MDKKTIVTYLDELLRLQDYPQDSSRNGLQVASSAAIKKICFSVDASLASIQFAAEQKAQLLVVHHGISWRDSLAYLTGRSFLLVRTLIENGIGLYAVHAPLDAHPLYGNNAQLFRVLQLKKKQPFGHYKGIVWGYGGVLEKSLSPDAFLAHVKKKINAEAEGIFHGPVKKIAVLSGGGGFAVEEAWEKGYDTLLTGETSHVAVVAARDLKMNLVFAGHYATERFGVLALQKHIKKKFPSLGVCFFENPTDY